MRCWRRSCPTDIPRPALCSLAGALLAAGCSSDPASHHRPDGQPQRGARSAGRHGGAGSGAAGRRYGAIRFPRRPAADRRARPATQPRGWAPASRRSTRPTDLTQRRVVFRFETVPPDAGRRLRGHGQRGQAAAPAGAPVRGLLRRCPPGRRRHRHRHRRQPAAADALVASVTNRLFPATVPPATPRGIPGVSVGVGVGSGGWHRLGPGHGPVLLSAPGLSTTVSRPSQRYRPTVVEISRCTSPKSISPRTPAAP